VQQVTEVPGWVAGALGIGEDLRAWQVQAELLGDQSRSLLPVAALAHGGAD
jgi:hypothetical protein